MLSYRLGMWSKARRIGAVCLTGVGCYAVVQGKTLRDKYRESQKLEPPAGKLSGLEKWREETMEELLLRSKALIRELKGKLNDNEKIIKLEERLEDLQSKIVDKLERAKKKMQTLKVKLADRQSSKQEQNAVTDSSSGQWNYLQRFIWHDSSLLPISSSSSASPPARKIRLVVLGDSLALGVGCHDKDGSPVMPQILARTLGQKLEADVEWHTLGVVGGTVADLHDLLPTLAPLLQQQPTAAANAARAEVVCVVICGLNDWKHFFERFGMGPWRGPGRFGEELQSLVSALGDLGVDRIFMPALPASLLDTDPSFSLGVWPLGLLVAFLCNLWDAQKLKVVEEFCSRQGRNDGSGQGAAISASTRAPAPAPRFVSFIDNPEIDRHYATPGPGNVSADGVHPSSQGYVWWGRWIAEHIVQEVGSNENPNPGDKLGRR